MKAGDFFHAEQHSQVRLVASCSVITASGLWLRLAWVFAPHS